MVSTAVAVGALASATVGQVLQGTASEGHSLWTAGHDTATEAGAHGTGGNGPAVAVAFPPATSTSDADSEVRNLLQNQKVTKTREKREAATANQVKEEKASADCGEVGKPAEGTFTSGFGPRWGTRHNGIDIANSIGTPICSVADGTVLEAGQANGFGLWVRIQHTDGTVTVYGHVHSFSVSAGETVRAGQQIAEMGNRGNSTAPHLHFEVWEGEGGVKIDPLPWLVSRGVNI